MRPSPRTVVVLAASLLILPSLGVEFASSADDKEKEKTEAPWSLVSDGRAVAQLEEAASRIQKKEWLAASDVLQRLLDGKLNTLACLANPDGKMKRYVSVRAEAERMLAALPSRGREEYQTAYGFLALVLLQQAREKRNAEQVELARIVDCYLYTDAGLEALRDLACLHAKARRFQLAAAAYTRLLEHVGPARWTDNDLYQAAVVFHHQKMSAPMDLVLKTMLGRTGQNRIRIEEKLLTVEELRKEMERVAPVSKPLEWPIYRGDAARSNRGSGGPPALEAGWRQSMFYEHDAEWIAKRHVLRAERKLQEKQEPIIPAFSPIALTVNNPKGERIPLLIYKNYWGVSAVDLRNGSRAWISPSNWSLQRSLNQMERVMAEFLDGYMANRPQILFENSTVGTLSTDGQFVYVVEDLAVPVNNEMMIRAGIQNQTRDKDLEDPIAHSRLFALSLARNGALNWALGDEANDLLLTHYFLGPPLPMDGVLYMLVQNKKQVSLACIDPGIVKRRLSDPKIIFNLPLVEIATPLIDDPIRRTWAAHLACSDGILVCPTNAGVLLGVDLLTNRLAWVYPYGRRTVEKPAPRAAEDRPRAAEDRSPAAGDRSNWMYVYPPLPDNFYVYPFIPKKKPDRPAVAVTRYDHWKATAPVIAAGKVVFAPPDDPTIYCLNLTDGSLLWSRKKGGDDVYLAGVYDGKVLVVGTKSVHAVSLTNGESLWTRETGLPSGQGVAVGDTYYLPLERGAQKKQPEILVLDIQKGQVIAHLQARQRHLDGEYFDVPGNLLFVDGTLISQGRWEIVAYPPRQEK